MTQVTKRRTMGDFAWFVKMLVGEKYPDVEVIRLVTDNLNTHKKLADKLIFLLEDESLMRKMGEAGRERVEKYFTWDLV